MLRRFVVLLHEHPDGDHWDLMLETEPALTTWAVPPQPLPLHSFECRVKKLPDHRRDYLDYEGPVSQNRGFVRRLDSGTYEIFETPEISETFEKHEIEVTKNFRLHGKLFNGILSVRQFNNDSVTFCFNNSQASRAVLATGACPRND
ncbi:MAG: hypothetical protein LBQ50_09665 [Planctomycetaceae bacterium]|nr:hypothetical protein [Planctomycetaceae bacterium]